MRNAIYVRDPFREFDNIVRRAFGPVSYETTRSAGFVPAAETLREGEDLLVRLELPGLDVAKDVEVEVRGRQLVVSGERREERSEESDAGRVQEFRYGGFRRAFRLGREVDAEQVTASYDAGVLTVRVTGAYAADQGHKIAISTAAPEAVEEPAEDSTEA